MKKALLFIFIVGSMPAFAQKMNVSKVPEPAKTSFSKAFTGVTDVKWEKEKGNYEVGFKQGDKKISAVYNDKGEWLETETSIELKQLPVVITEYIAKNYKGQKLKEAARIEKPNSTVTYEAEVDGKDLLFGPNGQFLSEAANK